MTSHATSGDSILSDAAVAERMWLLAELQEALRAAGIFSVLARKHRLVLRYSQGPSDPSGRTNPQLHIATADGTSVATTNGAMYQLSTGGEFAVAYPAAAADAIASCR